VAIDEDRAWWVRQVRNRVEGYLPSAELLQLPREALARAIDDRGEDVVTLLGALDAAAAVVRAIQPLSGGSNASRVVPCFDAHDYAGMQGEPYVILREDDWARIKAVLVAPPAVDTEADRLRAAVRTEWAANHALRCGPVTGLTRPHAPGQPCRWPWPDDLLGPQWDAPGG
jgi:hypothetical protein